MNVRERVGTAMVIFTVGLAPFAYQATLGFGLLALSTGLTGLVLFATARPGRSHALERADAITPRVPSPSEVHSALHPNGVHDAAIQGIDGGGGDSGH